MRTYQEATTSTDELTPTTTAPAAPCEETLIEDLRAAMGPAQWVEHKLRSLLNGTSLPVSHVRMSTHLGTRSHC